MSSSPVVIATWPFGEQAVRIAGDALLAGTEVVEAIVAGVKAVEIDPATGPYLIGVGGYPNSEGVIELDAAVMRGSDLHVGAVAGLQGIASPISVAKKVLDHSKHSMIAGRSAESLS